MPWLRRLVVGLSPQRHRLDSRSASVRIVMERVGPVHVFLQVIQFFRVSIIKPMLHTRLHVHVALLRKTNGRILGNRGALARK